MRSGEFKFVFVEKDELESRGNSKLKAPLPFLVNNDNKSILMKNSTIS